MLVALGAAYLAGLQAGIFGGLDDISRRWQCETRFAPGMASQDREALYAGWRAAVKKSLSRE